MFTPGTILSLFQGIIENCLAATETSADVLMAAEDTFQWPQLGERGGPSLANAHAGNGASAEGQTASKVLGQLL